MPAREPDTDLPSAEAMGVPVAEVLPAYADRADHFEQYATLRGTGAVEVPPHLLGPRERRLHIRNTLLEDHAVRLHESPDAVAGKFEILAGSAFSFFRGTALLYYRDHAGVDGHLPAVYSVGDVHPENFGIMPGADGRPFFGANDFDEAWVAPFTYDVQRGATGFALAAEAAGGKGKRRRRAVTAWVEAYIDGLDRFSRDDSEDTFRVVAGNAPPLLAPAFVKAKRSRESFLAKRIHLGEDRFRADERIEPRPDLVEVIQEAVDSYAPTVAGPDRPDDFFRVLDVALRHGSGTASQGLGRYWALLQGWSGAPADRVVVELKLARRSALYGLVPRQPFARKPPAERIVYAHRAFLSDGDALFGAAIIDGESYLVRERSPQKVNVSVADLSPDDLDDYARVCAASLAQLHARSEFELGDSGDQAEDRILSAVRHEVFIADVLEFAQEAYERVHSDHALFRADLERGAFR
ncbi:DUF2252 family protein [Agilicoccus flavus]|uniref:DUF2252 family protein n=1 Tax=Agilicoccus flavus TaxID=2775968 RepID=UPI001CF6E173|nr:DUF2252 family protein [Agilicoccus flavus]